METDDILFDVAECDSYDESEDEEVRSLARELSLDCWEAVREEWPDN